MTKWKKRTLSDYQANILRRARASGGIIYNAAEDEFSYMDGGRVGKRSVQILIAEEYLNPKDGGLFGDTPQIYGVGQ